MAAHPIAPAMTADTFSRIHGDSAENRYELIDGEVHPRPRPSSPHDSVKNKLKELFDRSGVDHDRCLPDMIASAYKVQPLQVSGPACPRTRVFDIEAKIPRRPVDAYEEQNDWFAMSGIPWEPPRSPSKWLSTTRPLFCNERFMPDYLEFVGWKRTADLADSACV